MSAARFPLGQMVATPGALEALAQNGQNAFEFIRRHETGDWGCLCDEDKQRMNFQLIKTSESSQPTASKMKPRFG